MIFAVVRISATVLMPIVNEIRDELASLKECLNETMSQLREDLEEYKNRTTSELADLQSSIDNPPRGIISRTVSTDTSALPE